MPTSSPTRPAFSWTGPARTSTATAAPPTRWPGSPPTPRRAVSASGTAPIWTRAPSATRAAWPSVSGSTFTVGGNYTTGGSTVVDGSLVASDAVTVSSGGSLAGSGTVTANVVNGGLVSSGQFSRNARRQRQLHADFDRRPRHRDRRAPRRAAQYDRLSISGLATLAGTLNISLINGFGPTQGQSFSIMTFGSRSGAFATINGLQSGTLTLFTADLGATDLILNAAATDADLAFDSVTIPASGTSGQNVSIPYTVRNLTTAPAAGRLVRFDLLDRRHHL